MQGLDVENKDWVSRQIPSTVNLLLLVSQWKCAHFRRQWKLKVTCGKTQVLKLFLHGQCWKPVSVQKAAIMTWSIAKCSRQGLPGKKQKKQTLFEMKRWPLYWQQGWLFPWLSLRADLLKFLVFDYCLDTSNLGILMKGLHCCRVIASVLYGFYNHTTVCHYANIEVDFILP